MPRLFLCLVLSSLSLALSYYLSISISPSTYIYTLLMMCVLSNFLCYLAAVTALLSPACVLRGGGGDDPKVCDKCIS